MKAQELRLLNSQLLAGTISIEQFKQAIAKQDEQTIRPSYGKAKKNINNKFNKTFRSLEGITNYLIKEQNDEDVKLFLSLISGFYTAKSNNEKRQILSKPYLTECLINADLYFKKAKDENDEIYTTDIPKEIFTIGQILTAIRKANIQ